MMTYWGSTILIIYIVSYPKKEWSSFINNTNQHFCSNEAIDLLSKMLVYDHVCVYVYIYIHPKA